MKYDVHFGMTLLLYANPYYFDFAFLEQYKHNMCIFLISTFSMRYDTIYQHIVYCLFQVKALP